VRIHPLRGSSQTKFSIAINPPMGESGLRENAMP
jgi:hypothetical protein